jgi:hypothetical protein
MSLGYDVSETMTSIRHILAKHTKGWKWDEIPDVVVKSKKEPSRNQIEKPDLLYQVSKALDEGIHLKEASHRFDISCTTASMIKRRLERYEGMPHDRDGILLWYVERKNAKAKARTDASR